MKFYLKLEPVLEGPSQKGQLVKDYKILVRYEISIVVEKKSLTKLFITRHNGLVLWLEKLLQDLLEEWTPPSRTTAVLSKSNLVRERRHENQAFTYFTTASPWKVLELKLPSIGGGTLSRIFEEMASFGVRCHLNYLYFFKEFHARCKIFLSFLQKW